MTPAQWLTGNLKNFRKFKMTILLSTNFVFFFLLACVWSKKTWLNFFIKVGLFASALGNAFFLLQLLGYIVKQV